MSGLRLALLLAVLAIALTTECCTASYLDPGDEDVDISGADYSDEPIDQILQDVASKRSSLIYVFRRACIRRGGNCDHRPGDCCHSSSCRCNLWGANCRCQRMGLFQKWG